MLKVCVIRDVEIVSAMYYASRIHAKAAAIFRAVRNFCFAWNSPILYMSVRAQGESTAPKGLVVTQLAARFIHLLALSFPGVQGLQDF